MFVNERTTVKNYTFYIIKVYKRKQKHKKKQHRKRLYEGKNEV